MNRIYSLLAAALLCTAARAGGFLTNSNQSASFGRLFALEGYTNVESAYYNPAGVGFLNNGWHFAFSNQSAFQTRTVHTTFAPFAANLNAPGVTTKKYKGTASAPILPSFDLGYVRDRWFGSFHFGVVGGGGKCEFKDGLGSFESVVSVIPSALNNIFRVMDPTGGTSGGATLLGNGYGLNTYMRGKQFFLGGQFGVGYRVTPALSVSVGGRLVYAVSNYYGYVNDIRLTAGNHPALGLLGIPEGTPLSPAQIASGLGQMQPALSTQLSALGGMLEAVNVNCDQKGWGFAPILGVSYKQGPLSIGARYEFKTRLRLKNESTTRGMQAQLLGNLAEFVDGREIENDIPALFAAGATYQFTPRFRASLAGHYYFDKQAHQFEHKEKRLDGNTWELLAGAEFDLTDRWTVSAGGQTTNYALGNDKAYITDLSFVTSSYSLGAGLKFRVNEKISLNCSYFKTLYYSTTKHQQDYNNLGATMKNIVMAAAAPTAQGGLGLIDPAAATPLIDGINTQIEAGTLKGKDVFDRTNDVVSIGLEVNF